MNASRYRHIWQAMPAFLRTALLRGGDAGPRLLNAAEELMEALPASAEEALLTGIFTDMVSAVWEASFFDTRAASVMHQVDRQIPVLPDDMKRFAAACAAARPADMTSVERLEDAVAAFDVNTLKALLEERRRCEPGNLYWFRFARWLAFRSGDTEWYASWVDALQNTLPGGDAFSANVPSHAASSSTSRSADEFPAVPSAARLALRAELAFLRGDMPRAGRYFAAAYTLAPLTDFLVKQAECLLRQGAREEAAACLRQAALRRPWQVNILLRLTDLLAKRNLPAGSPAGAGKILLYTWNHADDLDAALAALAASDLHGTGIAALNNGSTDHTAHVLRAWQDRLGKTLEVVTVPTNMGAPAARNWLLCLESVRQADWVIYLDDDALVPEHWLGWFGAAQAAYPQAEIIGCRVVEKSAPMTLQSVDLHFDAGLHLTDQGREQRHLSGGSVLLPYAMEAGDFGQFSYLRPCMSVTGCCHLITRRSLDQVGNFDLRFSPSQFDDYERDLRAALAGRQCVYQGHLPVRHIKRSGAAAGTPQKQLANIGGNLYKLWSTYSNDDVLSLIETDTEALRKDLEERLEWLE